MNIFLQVAAYFCQRLSGDVEKVFLSSFSADFEKIPSSNLGENVEQNKLHHSAMAKSF